MEEYAPEIKPMISGNANSTIELTPFAKAKMQTTVIAINVEMVVFSVLGKVWLMDKLTMSFIFSSDRRPVCRRSFSRIRS